MALVLRGVFWVTATLLVLDTAAYAWSAAGPLFGIGAVLFFPIAYFASPFIGGSVPLFLISIAAFAGSNLLGGRPVD